VGEKLNPNPHNSRASAWATAPPLRGGLLTQTNTPPAHNIQHDHAPSKAKRVTAWKTTNVYTPRGGVEADPQLIVAVDSRRRGIVSVWAPDIRSSRLGFPRKDGRSSAFGGVVWACRLFEWCCVKNLRGTRLAAYTVCYA
jgi:hypothetical protein